MAQRIQRLVESHKELSHGVSHELRTPIARLRFAMEMVREVDEQALRVKYLDTMDTNIEELDGLVDELLVYARFDREEPNLDIANHDLAEVIADQLTRFQETETQLDIEFIPSPDLTIKIDRAAICRVVDNLVRNAVRYAESSITVSYELVNDQVQIIIDDDGPGIPEQSRVELFKPFVRLDQSRDRKSGGIGLGLAIVKRLVELHHGSVWASANESGGARFVVSLPL
ncbi:MAG: ATP-binding protein, partial [Psychrosphaera sp.]|nr:ATP-binding protein [Psychrosphaera sp.]